MPYPINPDRSVPWNDLPELPISEELYRNIDVYEALANAEAALGRLQGRSIAIPNQAILINTISLQEAKASGRRLYKRTSGKVVPALTQASRYTRLREERGLSKPN